MRNLIIFSYIFGWISAGALALLKSLDLTSASWWAIVAFLIPAILYNISAFIAVQLIAYSNMKESYKILISALKAIRNTQNGSDNKNGDNSQE